MFVLGTAGHIDHGKSVLVRALTGIDPDRLREEKERGMTIDLGFAWLKLPSGREVGIVDVPGHERFVKNMLAGVGGIDLALLVVAANEGVMPQTREHLAILDLLRVQRGIVVITKTDLADPELLSLVKMEVEELIADTCLSGAPVLAVSAVTGEGLKELVACIDEQLEFAEARKDLGRPRLPIDRVFTIAGSGTVVTGTLIDGSLSVGQDVEILPAGVKSRIRGLQTHKSRVDTASPGSRVAVNLVGVTTAQLQRGDVVARPGSLAPVKMLTVKLDLLSYLTRSLRHGSTVSFHTGAAEVMGKVRLLEADEIKPGASTWAQLTLEKPVVAVNGDHFIIRSPMETLGGGVILDARARRLRRFRQDVIANLKAREEGTAEQVIVASLEASQPMEPATLAAQCRLPAEETSAAIDDLIERHQVVPVGEGDHRLLFTAGGWESIARRATDLLEDYHRRFPTRPGIPRVELASRMKLGNHAAPVLAGLLRDGTIVEEGGTVRLPAHSIHLTPAQQASVDAFLESLARNPYAPPGDTLPEPDLLNLLIEQGRVVKVADNIVFLAPVYDEMVAKVVSYIRSHGKVSLGEVRDMFQTSRKYAQAFLGRLDGDRITRRVGDERVLCQP